MLAFYYFISTDKSILIVRGRGRLTVFSLTFVVISYAGIYIILRKKAIVYDNIANNQNST